MMLAAFFLPGWSVGGRLFLAALIQACISTLMQGRLFERDIYTEKFLSAADAQAARSPLFRQV